MTDENTTDDGSEENAGVTDEALLEAISSGIDEVSEPAETDEGENEDGATTDDDTGTTEGDAGAEGEADTDEADEGATDGEDGDDATDEEEEGDGDTAADETDDGGDSKSETDGDGKKAGEADKEPDHINDPIPESTNKKTAERIQSLIEIAKENTQAAEQANEILTAIDATGADPQQYAATLAFVKLYNSETVDDRKKALEVARGVVRELSIALNDGADRVINLADHDDLLAEVEAGSLTQERAIEIATTRERKKMDDTRAAETQQARAVKEQTATQIANGRTQLNNLEATLSASDTSYAALRPAFLNMLKAVLPSTHPDDYGDVALRTYQALKAANPTLGQTDSGGKPAPKNKPLRPRGTAGGSSNKKGEPATAEDALNAALDSM